MSWITWYNYIYLNKKLKLWAQKGKLLQKEFYNICGLLLPNNNTKQLSLFLAEKTVKIVDQILVIFVSFLWQEQPCLFELLNYVSGPAVLKLFSL